MCIRDSDNTGVQKSNQGKIGKNEQEEKDNSKDREQDGIGEEKENHSNKRQNKQISENREGKEQKNNIQKGIRKEKTLKRKQNRIKTKKHIVKGIKRVGRKVFTGRNIARVAKGIGRGTMGAVGGTLGVAATIASGDVKNLPKFMAGGAALGVGTVELASGGLKLAGNTIKGIKNGLVDVSDTYRIGANNWTEKEYQEEVLIPRMKKENAKNKDIQDRYERELGSKKYLESSERDALYEAGIVDEDQIIKAISQQERDNISQNEMVQNALIASKIKDRKDLEAREKQLRKILEKQGLKNKELEKSVNERMKRISELSGIY